MLKPMIDLPFQPVLWGGEPHDFTEQTAGGIHGLNLGVYTAENTQRYICGTRSLTWDGRVFRYSKCGAAITNNKYGIKNLTVLVACKDTSGADNNSVTMTDAAVGETAIGVTFTAATLGNSESILKDPAVATGRTGVLYEHELCGGYISLYTGNYRQQRGIVGNTAVAVGDTSMIIYLDAPLDHELTAAASKCEILSNPYAFVGHSGSERMSNVGVALVTAVVGNYLWLQTWGPLRITDTGGAHGINVNERQFVFVGDGAIVEEQSATTEAHQTAGFLIEATYGIGLSAAPFIMLQISP